MRIILYVLISFVISVNVVNADEYNMCAGNSPPWTIPDKNGNAYGLVVDIMKVLLPKAGVNAKLNIMPFEKCLYAVYEGTQDGSFMIIKNEERERYAKYSDAYLEIPSYLYYSRKVYPHFSWRTWEDLEDKVIVIQKGFRYGPAFTQAARRHEFNLLKVDQTHDGLHKLINGKVHFVISNKERIDYLLKEHPDWTSVLDFDRRPISIGRIYLAISNRSPLKKFIPKINEAIEIMIIEGDINEILHRPPHR